MILKLKTRIVTKIIEMINFNRLCPNGPSFIELHPTNVCNSNCFFCNQKHYRDDNAHLDFETIRNLLISLKNNGLNEIRISGGGEPLTHPEFGKIYKLIKDIGLNIVGLNTNGLLLSKYIDLFCSAPFLQILHVSLQVPDKKSWSRITGLQKKKFDNIIKGVKEFLFKRNKNQQLVLSFSLCEEMFDRLSSIANIIDTNDNVIYLLHDLNMYQYSSSFLENLNTKVEYLKKIKEEFGLTFLFNNIQILYQLSNDYQISNTRKKSKLIDNNALCIAPWTSMLVRPDGDCYICCALGGKKHSIGNIKKNSINEIWYSDRAIKARNEATDFFFGECEYDRRIEIKRNYFINRCVNFCPVQNRLYSKPELADKLIDLKSIENRLDNQNTHNIC